MDCRSSPEVLSVKRPGLPFRIPVQWVRDMAGVLTSVSRTLIHDRPMRRLPILLSLALSVSLVCAAEPDAAFKVEHDVSYLPADRAEKLDLYLPERNPAQAEQRRPAILVIHGGGWRAGDKAAKRETQIAETLAKAGFVVASINYMMHPHPFDPKNPFKDKSVVYPRNVWDCKAAIRWLRVHADAYRIRPEAIGVIGGSAGGHLSMLMAWSGDEKELDPPEYPGVSTKVGAVVNLYGIPDVRRPIGNGPHPSGEGFTGKTPEQDPALYALLSPVDHLRADSAPILTLNGTKDDVVPYSYSVDLQKALGAKGVPHEFITVKDAPHTFLIWDPQAGYDYRSKIVSFFSGLLGKP